MKGKNYNYGWWGRVEGATTVEACATGMDWRQQKGLEPIIKHVEVAQDCNKQEVTLPRHTCRGRERRGGSRFS
ncbi:MAG: hypothetical protein HY906_13505 [Deltaproteobacteria bacterium]|nr:hypothetical protein [Deltaproteobacteria bacterium]